MKPQQDIVTIGDLAAPQRGEHAGKQGTITAIDGSKITISPFSGASWAAFEAHLADVQVTHPIPPELACWWFLDENMIARPTNNPHVANTIWKDPRRRVGRTEVMGKIVSTVFRGTPHPDLDANGELDWEHPLLWETVVFDPDPDRLSEGDGGYETYGRYATHSEARTGHDLVVEQLRGGPRNCDGWYDGADRCTASVGCGRTGCCHVRSAAALEAGKDNKDN